MSGRIIAMGTVGLLLEQDPDRLILGFLTRSFKRSWFISSSYFSYIPGFFINKICHLMDKKCGFSLRICRWKGSLASSQK